MANAERTPSHLKSWTDVQAYSLAVFCLVLGVALGYLFRGSASPGATSVQAAAGSIPQGQAAQAQVTPEQQKTMVDQAVAPLLATLKTNPGDLNTIEQVANLYYDGQQYPEAVKYYQLAVKSQPTNASYT